MTLLGFAGSKKRVLNLTKLLLTLLGFSIIFSGNFFDVKDRQRDAKIINLLKHFQEIDKNTITYDNFELEHLDYLAENDSKLSEKHQEVRRQMLGLLSMYGDTVSSISKGHDNSKNIFSLISMSEIRRGMDINDKIESERFQRIITINDIISEFKEYARPQKLFITTWVDTAAINQKLSEIERKTLARDVTESRDDAQHNIDGEWTYGPQEGTGNADGTGGYMGGPIFQVYTSKDSIYIYKNEGNSFNTGQDSGNGQGAKRLIPRPIHKNSIESLSFTFPSDLFYTNLDKDVLVELVKDSLKINQISNKYGYYDTSMMDDILVHSIDLYNKPIALLGFDISRKWLPLSMLLVTIFVSYNLYSTLSSAHRINLMILSKDNSDEFIESYMRNRLFRVFVWVVAPVIILYASSELTLVKPSIIFRVLNVVGIFTCFFLGVVSCRISEKL